MKGIPSIRLTNGKYVHGRQYVEAIFHAADQGKKTITVGGQNIRIVSNIKTDEDWTITVQVEGEQDEKRG